MDNEARDTSGKAVWHADVAILGAGPAGSAAAIRCALNGLRVVMIERRTFPRLVPGETLHPGVLPLLEDLGVDRRILAAGFLRHAGHYVRWHSPERFVAFGGDAQGAWLGFQAWRPDFDMLLLERVRKLGAKVCLPRTATSVVTEHGRLIGVETETEIVLATWFIDATGRRRWLARQLGLTTGCRGPRRIAWHGYVQGECTARQAAPALRADAGGWTWTAQVRPNVYQWTRLNLDNRRPPESWLPEELLGLAPHGPMCGTDVTCQMVRSPAGSGYFLIGDAACVLDPASSHGVLKAIMSGMMAGRLITRLKLGEIGDATAAQVYSEWLRDWYRRDVRQLEQLYNQLLGAESL